MCHADGACRELSHCVVRPERGLGFWQRLAFFEALRATHIVALHISALRGVPRPSEEAQPPADRRFVGTHVAANAQSWQTRGVAEAGFDLGPQATISR
ncbi:MAG: hypothetical protein ACR2NZ_17835 [Rubripirellula sp.]